MIVKKYLTIFNNVSSATTADIIKNINADTFSFSVSGTFTSLSIEISGTATFEDTVYNSVSIFNLSDNSSCNAITEAGLYEIQIASLAKIKIDLVLIAGGNVTVTGKMIDGGNSRMISIQNVSADVEGTDVKSTGETSGKVLTTNGSGGASWEDASGGTTVVANPTLAGTEADLTGLQVGETKYKIPSGGGSEYDVILTNQTDEFSPEYAAFVQIFSEIETNYKAGTEPERFEKRVKIQDVWGSNLDYICIYFGGISFDAFCYAFIGRDPDNNDNRTGYYVYADVMERDVDDGEWHKATYTKHDYYAGLNDPYDTMNCAYTSFNSETCYYNGVMVIGYDPDLKEE